MRRVFKTVVGLIFLGVAVIVVWLYSQGFAVFTGLVNVLTPHPAPLAEPAEVILAQDYQVTWLANLTDLEIFESSGLTVSEQHPGVLWTINDSGNAPTLYALDQSGQTIGSFVVDTPQMIDWESLDLASIDGVSYIVVGDVGDNFRWRQNVVVHFVPEPTELSDDRVLPVISSLTITFPGGARDIEGLAVDLARDRLLMVSKRHVPPELFAVALEFPLSTKTVQAVKVAELAGIPRPTVAEFELASKLAPYRYMPTGMDVAGDRMVITTYQHLYVLDLSDLHQPSVQLTMPLIGQREAASFDAHGKRVFISRERTEHDYAADVFVVSGTAITGRETQMQDIEATIEVAR